MEEYRSPDSRLISDIAGKGDPICVVEYQPGLTVIVARADGKWFVLRGDFDQRGDAVATLGDLRRHMNLEAAQELLVQSRAISGDRGEHGARLERPMGRLRNLLAAKTWLANWLLWPAAVLSAFVAGLVALIPLGLLVRLVIHNANTTHAGGLVLAGAVVSVSISGWFVNRAMKHIFKRLGVDQQLLGIASDAAWWYLFAMFIGSAAAWLILILWIIGPHSV